MNVSLNKFLCACTTDIRALHWGNGKKDPGKSEKQDPTKKGKRDPKRTTWAKKRVPLNALDYLFLVSQKKTVYF